MIRRFYIMPLKAGATEAQTRHFVDGLNAADMFMSGLFDSSAGIDFDSRTVLWEHNFIDEKTYTEAYMVHPYHAATLDDALMPDSPEYLTQDTFTVRYQPSGAAPRIGKGIRRVVLLNLPEGADTSAMEALSAPSADVATSVFSPDNIGWVSFKGRAWTHIWEQGFTDREALERYLRTRPGIASSSLEGLKREGVEVKSLKVLTCPFALKPAQSPTELSGTFPTFYTVTARTALEDADAYIALLQSCYDPYVREAGGKLLHRWRTVEGGYREAEVQSTWELKSVAAYNDLRLNLATENWQRFVREAMPLVKGGTRRFYRAV
jgi:hypothetical protein